MGLYLYNRHMSTKVNHLSTIILAEAKGNLIDGLISGAIGIAILLLYLVPINSWFGFLHYTGDFLTLALAIISFKEPWNLLVASFKELANGTIHFLRYMILSISYWPYLKEDSNDVEIHIFKQGMKIRVKINLHNVHHEIIQNS